MSIFKIYLSHSNINLLLKFQNHEEIYFIVAHNNYIVFNCVPQYFYCFIKHTYTLNLFSLPWASIYIYPQGKY